MQLGIKVVEGMVGWLLFDLGLLIQPPAYFGPYW